MRFRWASSPSVPLHKPTRWYHKALPIVLRSVYIERIELPNRTVLPVTDSDTFIERIGLTAESDGLSRIAGRLFGALLLDSEPRSLDELADQLGVSKASMTT